VFEFGRSYYKFAASKALETASRKCPILTKVELALDHVVLFVYIIEISSNADSICLDFFLLFLG